ncbi:unnamed protein product [Leuciscus chuanchicus]
MRHFELRSGASARGPRARSHLMEPRDIKAEDYSSARGHIHRLIIRLVPNPDSQPWAHLDVFLLVKLVLWSDLKRTLDTR